MKTTKHITWYLTEKTNYRIVYELTVDVDNDPVQIFITDASPDLKGDEELLYAIGMHIKDTHKFHKDLH